MAYRGRARAGGSGSQGSLRGVLGRNDRYIDVGVWERPERGEVLYRLPVACWEHMMGKGSFRIFSMVFSF